MRVTLNPFGDGPLNEKLILGNIYRRTEGDFADYLYVAVQSVEGTILCNLKTGTTWSPEPDNPWGSCGAEGWQDVTDRYEVVYVMENEDE